MARGYSSELQTASLYKTNEWNLALPALEKGGLRKNDILIDAAARLPIGVSNDCCAVCERRSRAFEPHLSNWNIKIFCTFTLYCLLSKHSPPGRASLLQAI